MAYRSSYGNPYLSMRENMGDDANPRNTYVTITRSKDGAFHVINRTGKFAPPLNFDIEMTKKGDALICTTNLSIENEKERDLISSFLNGKLKADELPEAPKRGRKPKNGESPVTQETTIVVQKASAPVTTETPTISDKQTKMAQALVKAGQAKNLVEAFEMLGISG